MLYDTNPKVNYETDNLSSIRVREVTFHKKKRSFVLLPSSKILALVHFTNVAQYLCFLFFWFPFQSFSTIFELITLA